MTQEPLGLYPMRVTTDLPAVTTAQMREIHRLAVEDAGLDLLQMMESAGRALATVVREYLPDAAAAPAEDPESARAEPAPVLVLAGRGNNGGGALAAARLLRNWGLAPVVVLAAPPGSLGEAAAHQHRTLHKDGLRALWPGAPEFDARFPRALEQATVVVDGLVGYGLEGPLRGDVALLVEAVLDRAPPAVISLDVPSGFDATTGDVHASGIVATATVTLALPKTGLLRSEAAAAVGELLLADIGIPPYVFERLGLSGTRGLFAAGPMLRLLTDAGD